MSIQKVVVEQKSFGWVPGGAFILKGWAALNSGETAAFQVLDESGAAVAADYSVDPRPDIVRRYPAFAVQEATLGFHVTVPDIERCFDEHEKLTVILTSGGQSRTLFSGTTARLKRKYYDSSIRYFLDVCEYIGETITIKGWIVDITGECFPLATDKNGTPLPVQPVRSIRKDLVDILGLDLDFYEKRSWGFSFCMPGSELPGSHLLLQMKNPYTEKTLDFTLPKLSFLATRPGKLLATAARQNPEKIRTDLRTYGLKGYFKHAKSAHFFTDIRYESWLAQHQAGKAELHRQRSTHFAYEPLFSFVIPLYNTRERYLKELLDSILAQTYPKFEVCLADGSTKADTGAFVKNVYRQEPRIRLLSLEENRGISENTNAAIRMAAGEFLVFSDHDDFLEPDALYEIVRLLNEDRNLDVIYTDEDLTDETSKHFNSPRFKPDFNPDFLRSINYICHLTMVRKSVAERAGLLRKESDGAQDYDFLLRVMEQTDRFAHIPRILYHWRASNESTAGNQDSKQYAVDAGLAALREHCERIGWQADADYTGIFIIYKVRLRLTQSPLVTILIPNKDHTDLLDTCVQSIFEKTDYTNYEILIVENNSEETATFNYYEKMQKEHEHFRVITYKGGFNYSAINNFGVRHAHGEYILFLNNDTEVISPFWIREMLGFCQRENTAAVGAKLYYADGEIQHGGVIVGIGNFAGHAFPSTPGHENGYMGRLQAVQDISAVTAACMLVKRSVFELVGGFDEDFAVSLNDVDLCLRIREKGYLIVMDPQVELYHYESKSRGYENTPEKRERFKEEILHFRERWADLLEKGDPYYNPNLTLVGGSFDIRQKNEVPPAWVELFGEDSQ